MSEAPLFLSVVVPAFDEAPRIGACLDKIAAYLDVRGRPYEIIAVDDGSTDGTGEILARRAAGLPRLRLLANEANRGKGLAVRKGVLASRGDYVLFTDADLPTPMPEIEKLLSWLGRGFEVAFGSRALAGSEVRVRQPRHRELIGRAFNWLVRLTALGGVRDTQCGFKCFKGEAARKIFARSRFDGFCFDVEVLWIARRLGCRLKEVPVVWCDGEVSHVDLVADAAGMLFDLLRLRVNDWRGLYGGPALDNGARPGGRRRKIG